MSDTLQFVTCPVCNSSYLVGIKGKDIRQVKTEGGMFGDTPFMAIGHDQMDGITKTIREGDVIPSPCGCGADVVVHNAGEVKRHDEGNADSETNG